MRRIPRMVRVWLVVMLVAVVVRPCVAQTAQQAGPVALLELSGDAKQDNKRMLHNVLFPADVVFERSDDLDAIAGNLARYSVVFMWSVDKPLSEQQLAQLEKYVADGGTLVHTGTGLFYNGIQRKYAQYPWLGALAWGYNSKSDTASDVQVADHPLLKGIDFTQPIAWANAHYFIKPNEHTKVILGGSNHGTLTVTQWKKGRVVWVMSGLFRMGYNHKEVNLAQAIQLYTNIVNDCQPLTTKQALAAAWQAEGRKASELLIWQRDWDYSPQAGPRFVPAAAKASERLTGLSFYSAMDELDTTFLLCQSLEPQRVKATLSPLVNKGTRKVYESGLRLYVSEQPPVVTARIPKDHPDWPAKLGRYHLKPLAEGVFEIDDVHPRVVWVALDTKGLPSGEYEAQLTLSGERGSSSVLPVQVKVYPVRMPSPRLVDIRLWGGGFPNRQPFLRELGRQGVEEIYLEYPDLNKIRLRDHDMTLAQAMRSHVDLFKGDTFPALDFTQAYDPQVLAALDNGLFRVRTIDLRTPATLARRAGGAEHARTPVDQWPEPMQKVLTGYMAELGAYFHSRGMHDASIQNGDEPSLKTIMEVHLPQGRMVTQAGFGYGTTWTTPGFDAPETTAKFSPHITVWSMYKIMMDNFLGYIRQGKITLHPDAVIGVLRGGWGLALRNAPNDSRTYAWNIIYYGQPVSFISTGPIWKEWKYYIHTDMGDLRNMPEGVSGERLVAYGSSDDAADVDLWSSSDWEATRDGVDDANLDRILTRTLDALEPGASGALKQKIQAIRKDRAGWFSRDEAAAGASHIQLKGETYKHETLHYDYVSLVPPSTQTLDRFKQRILDHLETLAAEAAKLPATLLWNRVTLAGPPQPAAVLIRGTSSSAELDQAIATANAKARQVAGVELAVKQGEASLPAKASQDNTNAVRAVVVGLVDQPHVQQAIERYDWAKAAKGIGQDQYVIHLDQKQGVVAVIATSERALAQGVRHWAVSLRGENHWFVPHQAR